MRKAALLVIAGLSACASSDATPSAGSANPVSPPATPSVDRWLSGVVKRKRGPVGDERYEVEISSPRRPRIPALVDVERTNASSFNARASLKDVLRDSGPWIVVVELSTLDWSLPSLSVGEAVVLMDRAVGAIAGLDDDVKRPRCVSDVVPFSR